MYKSLFLLLLGSTVVASEGTQILYSINMPGNPFQQPYYQMMIKADNENSVYSFSSTNLPQIATFNAVVQEDFCNSGLNTQTNVTSDYVALYAAGLQDGTANGNNFLSIMYGLSPYIFRGYTEGAASKLYMQRPAQVQLPFNPLFQNGVTVSPVNATLPDYSDVFLAQKASDIYQSLGCSSSTCAFNDKPEHMPSWYTYIQRKVGPGGEMWKGFSAIFYGTMSSLSQVKLLTSLSLYNEPQPYETFIPLGVSKLIMPIAGNSYSLSSYCTIGSKGVFDDNNSWSSCFSPLWDYNAPSFMLFAPIISPGYAGDAPAKYNGGLLETVIATGYLIGNYSVLNMNNPYIASGNPATTYDGVTLNNGMSYFQLFAQNMQWFSLGVGYYCVDSLSPLNNPPVTNILQNVTPGQGIFSDAIQIAAMQAPAAISTGAPVFTGSLGVTAGITGPVTMNGGAQTISGPVNFNVPQAFLSELTVNSFTVGRYLQVPLVTQMPSSTQRNGTWSGGLVKSASEDPLQYYQGVTPKEYGLSLMPYLPVYFSDPGRPVDQPGWNYCPLKNFNETSNAQMCYDTAVSPMTNFYSTLTLEIDVAEVQLAATQLAATQLAATQLAATQLAATQLVAAQLTAAQLAAEKLAAPTQLAAATQLGEKEAAEQAAPEKQLAAAQLAATQVTKQEEEVAKQLAVEQEKAAELAAKAAATAAATAAAATAEAAAKATATAAEATAEAAEMA